ncbi:hypothetical protein I203_100967 [Kwoniella mangroviensis CBS 8507]|uniref:uncharacterized protein n=1 Tax=Kwoniella mangroviensis CBS 8507 TaxID=1296122 RepID=UPI00080D3EC8|nr:uncharacterized protein I203_02607 [Kwoniella mangroviensis CBS 8507]OCF67949.1 hypothetical protein I203_02607 [Kwoniella mangroviensis CBS 8507]
MIATLASPACILLPPELYLNIVQLLLSQGLRKSVAALHRCSRSHYTFVAPYLYESFTLNAEAAGGIFTLLRDSTDSIQQRLSTINLVKPIKFDDTDAVRYIKLLRYVKRLFVPLSSVLLLHDEVFRSLCGPDGSSSADTTLLFQHIDYLSLYDEEPKDRNYVLRMRLRLNKDAIQKLIDFIVLHLPPLGKYQIKISLQSISAYEADEWIDSGMHTAEARESDEGYQYDILYPLSNELKIVKLDQKDQAVTESIKPVKMIVARKEHLTEDNIQSLHRRLLEDALVERGQHRSGTSTDDVDPEQVALAHEEVEKRKKCVEWVVREDCQVGENCRVCSGGSTPHPIALYR